MNPIIQEIKSREYAAIGFPQAEEALAALKVAVEYLSLCDCTGCTDELTKIAKLLGVGETG